MSYFTTHKLSGTSEFRAYHKAKARCNNPNDMGYINYGGRGIKFKFTSLEELIKEIGYKPSGEYSLDRINVDGNYEKGNVRWATRQQQNLNQRLRKDNSSGYRGVTHYPGVSPRKWMAYIRCEGKRLHIGNFYTPEEAAYVRDQFALIFYGDNYNFNVLNEDYLNCIEA